MRPRSSAAEVNDRGKWRNAASDDRRRVRRWKLASVDRGTAGQSGQEPGRPTVQVHSGAHPSVIGGNAPGPREGKLRSVPLLPAAPTARGSATMPSLTPP